MQHAAVAALVKSRAPGATAVLAGALPTLEAGAAEKALEELSFRKDPATIDGLERFLQLSKGTKPGALDTAVRALAVIPTERAARVLGVVLSDPAHAPLLRRTAGDHLLRSSLPIARRLLEGFVRQRPRRSDRRDDSKGIAAGRGALSLSDVPASAPDDAALRGRFRQPGASPVRTRSAFP